MQPIGLFTRKLLCLSVLTMLCTAIALPARAHEARITDDGVYEIIIGWKIEPPVEGVRNALVFFADIFDPPGQVKTFALLDRREGDTVKLNAVLFRLDTDNVNSKNIKQVLAHMVEMFPALPRWKQCRDTTPGCEGQPGYLSSFKPKKAGTYGVFLVGQLKRHNHDGFVFPPNKFFAETFVCGRGTQNPKLGGFECVEQAP